MNKFTRKDFLETLFHEYFRKREGFILVKTVRNIDRKASTRYFPNVEILAKEQYLSDQNVFFGVCPHENMKPERTYIQYLVALWCGLDLSPEGYSGKQVYFFGQAQAAKAVRSFPLPPSIIVESGQGLHLYWLLKQVTRIENPEAVETVIESINNYFQCATPVGIDSLLRLPETTNCKVPSREFQCRVKYINPDFRYDLEEFGQLNLGSAGGAAKSSSFPDSGFESQSTLAAADKTGGPKIAHVVQIDDYEDSEDPDLGSDEYEDAGSMMDSGEMSSMVDGSTTEESQTVVVLAEESADLIADEIVDKVVDRLTDRLMEMLVDQIVEKLVQRLTTNK
ncbi:MAG: hypothetical protein HY912_02535 [Desulfomonile tiedjei]|uniref:Uncharacterized protein n=1 Tax=Desulfomonile tiedjei TaxID=2358 RepID=A0A9D6V374_9BACT|nr:hypothetical protein [Desulfomonile tiedjei]